MKCMWVVAVVAASSAACSSSGLSPKAFGTDAGEYQPVAAIEDTGLDKNSAEPVVVAPEVVEGFQFLYRFITEVEFVLCLEGTRKNGRLHIDGFRLARMEASSVNSVRYQPARANVTSARRTIIRRSIRTSRCVTNRSRTGAALVWTRAPWLMW